MTCKVQWNPIANMPIFICTDGEEFITDSQIDALTQKHVQIAVILGALAIPAFLIYKAYRFANPIRVQNLGGLRVVVVERPNTHLKAMKLREKIENGADLDITDQRDKPLRSYSTVGLMEPPKGLILPDQIPEEFENDETYPKYVCPLTQCLIRFPRLDPTDGTTLYEQSAIEHHLEEAKTSPMTRDPLTEDDLVEVPNIARYIKMRLFQYHKETRPK